MDFVPGFRGFGSWLLGFMCVDRASQLWEPGIEPIHTDRTQRKREYREKPEHDITKGMPWGPTSSR